MIACFKRIFFLLVGVALALPFWAATPQKKYEILYVQSYTERDTWSKEQCEGLGKGFADHSIPVNITTEYLNSRYWNQRGEEELMRRFCRRAADRNTDLIVVSNDEALYSLLACGDSLPHQIPIVFFGVEYPNTELLSKFSNVTGLKSPHPYDTLLETAKSIFPKRYNVITLAQDNVLSTLSRNEFNENWTKFYSENPKYSLKEFNLMNDAMTDVLYDIQLSSQSKRNFIVVPYWGLYMPSLTKVSKAPTFTTCNSALLNGVFCTAAPNAYNDARNAAHIACQIIIDKKPSEIEIKESPYELTFDYSQLQYFNVDKKMLPPGSVIVNEPYMQKYGLWIGIALILLFGIFVLIVISLISLNRRESRKRVKAQTKLLIQDRLVAQRDEFDNVFHSIRDGVVTQCRQLKTHIALL